MDKNIIITGGTKGIGRAIVELLASEGCHIAFCARTDEHVRSLEKSLKDQYPQQAFYGHVVDMSAVADVERFGKAVLRQFERVDALINNAGIFMPGELLTEDEGMLDLHWRTNVLSAYTLTRQIAPLLKRQKSGDIINMCSIAGLQAYDNGGSYCISKFAMRGMSLALREELKAHLVRVTTIYPGATWSDSWAGVDLPQDRLMSASDIAKSVLLALRLDSTAVMEEVILRPQLGDL